MHGSAGWPGSIIVAKANIIFDSSRVRVNNKNSFTTQISTKNVKNIGYMSINFLYVLKIKKINDPRGSVTSWSYGNGQTHKKNPIGHIFKF